MQFIGTIKQYIIDNFLFEDDGILQPNTSFLENAIIDSTGVLELAAYLEETFNVVIEDHEFIPENLDSLVNIDAFLNMKLGEGMKKAV